MHPHGFPSFDLQSRRSSDIATSGTTAGRQALGLTEAKATVDRPNGRLVRPQQMGVPSDGRTGVRYWSAGCCLEQGADQE